jgi:hypothetical protein
VSYQQTTKQIWLAVPLGEGEAPPRVRVGVAEADGASLEVCAAADVDAAWLGEGLGEAEVAWVEAGAALDGALDCSAGRVS